LTDRGRRRATPDAPELANRNLPAPIHLFPNSFPGNGPVGLYNRQGWDPSPNFTVPTFLAHAGEPVTRVARQDAQEAPSAFRAVGMRSSTVVPIVVWLVMVRRALIFAARSLMFFKPQ
jgi:hypothetical protein